MGSLLANPLTVLFVGFQVLGIGVAQGAVLLNVLRPMVQGVTLVFYDVFWRACDWYTNRARAHNLHVRTYARACAHAQAHADLRIFKDCYFCIGGSRCPQSTLTIRNFSLSLSIYISVFPMCVRRRARRAHPCALACALSHVRRSRGQDQPRTLVQILGNLQYSLQSLDAMSTDK